MTPPSRDAADGVPAPARPYRGAMDMTAADYSIAMLECAAAACWRAPATSDRDANQPRLAPTLRTVT